MLILRSVFLRTDALHFGKELHESHFRTALFGIAFAPLSTSNLFCLLAPCKQTACVAKIAVFC